MSIKENYKKLQKKYRLPKFEDINKDFEIITIEKKEFLLREVRRKISEKLELFAKLLEGIFLPDATLTNLYESKIFTDKEREKIYNLFKKLMFFNRLSIETSINENNAKTSNFIKTFWKYWTKMKRDLEKVIKKIKDSWKKEIEFKQELSYIR